MKPFNLEAAKAGKPIVTRDGRVAKFVAHVPEADAECQVVMLVGTRLYVTAADGQAFNVKRGTDLFMVEEEITVYFNEYKGREFGQVERDKDELACGYGVVKVHEVKIKV